MRKILIALALVAACGGGDDVNDPAAPQFHTLTVSGGGDGAGNVTTATTPALDCALAAGQASGTCSADYPENTGVSLSATPQAGSTFTGWSGDAQSCGTAATCSIEMTSSKSAVAGFSAAAATGSVQVTSSAWYPDLEFGDEGIINWVVEVRNTGSQTVEVARVDFVSHDAAGNILASDFTFVGPIPPGETRANEGLADYHGTESAVDIRVADVQFAAEDPGLGVAQIASSNWRADPSFGENGAIVWTVEVQNNGTMEVDGVKVDFVTYDASGQILDYDFTFVGPIPPGGRSASEGLAELRGGEANVNFQVSEVDVTDNLRLPE
jgi:predicted secreted protein